MAPVDRDKLRAHIDFVRRTVGRLQEIAGTDRETFLDDDIVQAATIRYLHTAIEALLDIANHVVAREGFGVPKRYQEAIDLLVEHGVLPGEHQEAFRRMVRFRNRAVHLYDQIDAAEVHRIVSSELGDFESFLTAIVRRYFGER